MKSVFLRTLLLTDVGFSTKYRRARKSCDHGNSFILPRIHAIPLISRVRGPYGKLWTEFFPSFYGPSAKRAGHENKEGKNEDP